MLAKLRELTAEELRLARLVAWEEVREAPEGGRKEIWSGILTLVVLEEARRAGRPVSGLMGAALGALRREAEEAPEQDWREAHNSLCEYATARAGYIEAHSPSGRAQLRSPALEEFWQAVRRFIEG